MDILPLETDTSALCFAGCGSVIKEMYFPQTLEELEKVYQKTCGKEKLIVGGMSNLLVLDEYKGVGISSALMKGISIFGDKLRIKAGENWNAICSAAQSANLGGVENFFGLPGTIGGAVSGNSGCFGSDISEVLESINVFRLDDGQVETLSREEIAFGYRYSNLRKNKDFIVEITLQTERETPLKIAEKMAYVRKMRQLKQPKGRSLGSFFKQYKGVSAGYYIEQAGLKGYEKNHVKVSETHANFFINNGGNAREYFEFGNEIAKIVYEKLGIKLEREVVVIGETKHQRNCV